MFRAARDRAIEAAVIGKTTNVLQRKRRLYGIQILGFERLRTGRVVANHDGLELIGNRCAALMLRERFEDDFGSALRRLNFIGPMPTKDRRQFPRNP